MAPIQGTRAIPLPVHSASCLDCFCLRVNGSTTFTGLNEDETAFSEELLAYWLSFVRSGDPNTYKLQRSPQWPSYATGQRIVLQQRANGTFESLGESGVYAEDEPSGELERCAFIATKSEHMQD